MATLTKRQKQIFNYIDSYLKKNGFSPTFQEIRKHFRLSALSTVHQHIKILEEKGFIEKTGNSARGIEIKENKLIPTFLSIPILGIIAAGKPIEAIELPSETIPVLKSEIGKFGQYYALKVQGESMINEGILDGDIVIIKKQSVAENGQTVVAIIDDNEATLKKIYREKNQIRLQPANQSMLPIYRKEVEIRGIVIKIIRNINDDQEQKERNYFRTIDLFAGVGGIRAGFEKAGFETIFANDFDQSCKATYDLNFKTSKLIVEDIKKIGIYDLPEFDFLLAGFPCQAFSVAGYRQGFKDERGNLFFNIAKIIEVHKPVGFLLENVKNLKGHDNGRTFNIITRTLEDLGYNLKTKILNSSEYGNVPQNRERIYIVGFKNRNHFQKFNFPKPVQLSAKIKDVLEKGVDQKYYYNNKQLFKKLEPFVKKTDTVYQWRRKYVRENKKGLCPTLTANMGMGGHNVPIIKDKKGIRKLTPKECFRLQGFPSNFLLPNLSDSALYKQAGNSVTVTVIESIAKEIKEAIS